MKKSIGIGIEDFKEQGQYPVIFISLKSIKNKSWEEWLFNY